MTTGKTMWRSAAAVLAALALSGCAATHVGEDWQCPLAQGKVCASVAAADPAVPETAERGALAIETPLHRPRKAAGAPEAEPKPEPEGACETGCDPFAWLAGLFSAKAGDDPDAATPDDASKASASSDRSAEDAGSPDDVPGGAGPETGTGVVAASPAPTVEGDAARAETETASETAANGADASVHDEPPVPLPAEDELRTGEAVARVWIAPFVDADGVYREGAWVRVVIEPARWRLK